MIKFDYDLSDFQRKADIFINKVKEKESEILDLGMKAYVNRIARSNPPSNSSTDSSKIKYRSVYPILYLIKHPRYTLTPQSELKEMYNQKMRFAVLDTRKKHSNYKKVIAYTKTKGEAKQEAFIERRGLVKALWGLALGEEKLTGNLNWLASIIRKHPEIKNVRNDIYRRDDGKDANELYLELENKSYDIRTPLSNEEFAISAARRTIEQQIKNISEETHEL